jgi:hypothetical protein
MSAVLSKARIVLISLGESLAGRPSFRPRTRAASDRPRCVPDQIAFELSERGETMKDQLFERVSIFSVRDSKWILRVSSSVISRTKSARFLPNRSSRHTAKVSPSRKLLRQASNCGRRPRSRGSRDLPTCALSASDKDECEAEGQNSRYCCVLPQALIPYVAPLYPFARAIQNRAAVALPFLISTSGCFYLLVSFPK